MNALVMGTTHAHNSVLVMLKTPSFATRQNKDATETSPLIIVNHKSQRLVLPSSSHFTTMSNCKKHPSVSTTALAPKKKMKLEATSRSAGTPTELLVHAFQENGYSAEQVTKAAQAKLLKLTPEMTKAYSMEVSTAAREDDLDRLIEMHRAGATMDCCNKFGDSLIHIACRRGHTRIVKFLVEEAEVSIHRVDDLKRTPLHDACWTAVPNFDIVEMILRAAPEQALSADNRGFTPFDYARPQHSAAWMQFLSKRKPLMVVTTDGQ